MKQIKQIKQMNIATALLRIIPTLCLLLAVSSVNSHHINWKPRLRHLNLTQKCGFNVSKPINPVAIDCSSKLRS